MHFTDKVIGFDRSTGKVDVESSFQILDARTGKAWAKPAIQRTHYEDKQVLDSLGPLYFCGQFTMHAPGDFILRLSATDRVTGKTTTRDYPIHVRAR